MKKIIALSVFLLLVLGHIKVITSNTSLQAGYISVSGRWWYWIDTDDRLPVGLTAVVIYDLEPDNVLYPVGSTFTDIYGYFNSDPILNDDGPGEDGLDIVVGVLTASPAAEVIDPSTNWYYFSLSDLRPNCPDGPINMGENLNTTRDERGAWRTFSVHFGLTAGWHYLYSVAGYNMPLATCLWPYGDVPSYDPATQVILMPYWAAWYPDIILNGYAHYVMNITYGYLPPVLPEHSINETSDASTAWVEGWGEFFPLAVFDNPYYIDINLEAPHWCSEGWDDGDEVEGRVAGALWDIYDSQNDSEPWYYDSFSDGFTRIWNIMETTPCNNFTEFWQAWNTSGYPKQPALMAIFQNTIDYRGPGDVNADGKVRIDDVNYVASLFGTLKGDEDWDKRADVSPPPYGDDKIRIDDVRYVAKRFGKDYDC